MLWTGRVHKAPSQAQSGLGLDGALMSLLQEVIQAQILAEAGDKPLRKGKVVGAVQ